LVLAQWFYLTGVSQRIVDDNVITSRKMAFCHHADDTFGQHDDTSVDTFITSVMMLTA
jgi:hypothetical protein